MSDSHDAVIEDSFSIAGEPMRYIVVPLLCLVYNVFAMFDNYILTPIMEMWQRYKRNHPEHRLLVSMSDATTYHDWCLRALDVDRFMHNDAWRKNPVSPFYDYKLIRSQLAHLENARQANDIEGMMYLLRGGLLRNFGGICDRRLFLHSFLGTKTLIEDYLEEVVAQIDHIEKSDALPQQTKLKFLSDTRQGFGCSALVLQGGTALALYHLGVLKALNEQGLLPRIISGTAVGALIAALICIHTDEELPGILQPNGINLTAFSRKSDKGHVKRRITRFLKYGYLMDMKVLQECVRENVGDLTFEEAYTRTKRVLNISVSSSRTQEVPQLLNYLTAPNVLIWSAACCSTASMGLFGGGDLLAKDKNGRILKWNASVVKWNHFNDATANDGEEPLHRLTELFNVNHFIVSQAVAYAIPFISKANNLQHDSMWNKVAFLIASEFKHRLYQLDQVRMLPRALRPVIEEKITGNVTIIPDLSVSDFKILFSNPTHSALAYWILQGERSTWPLLSFIRTRCKIELALDKAVLRLRAMNIEQEPVVVSPTVYGEPKKRARSMH